MPHQWMEGNLPAGSKCSVCQRACGTVLRLQDYRCIWCKSTVGWLVCNTVGSRCSLVCSGLHVTCCVCLHRVVVAWIGGHSCGLVGTHVDWWALMWIGGHMGLGALMWIGGHSCGLGGTHVDCRALVFVGSHVCIVCAFVCVCVRVCVDVPECQGKGEKCMWQ